MIWLMELPVSTYSMHKQLQLVGAMDMIFRCPSDNIHNAAASVDWACEPQGKLHAPILYASSTAKQFVVRVWQH